MSKTIEQIIGYENLTGIITDPRGAVPSELIPAGFTNTAGGRQVAGDSAKYTRIDGTRQTARLVQYGSASVKRGLKNIAEVPVKLMHTHEHINHEMRVLTALRQYDNPQLQARGQQEVDRQTAAFRMLFNNLRSSAIFSIFRFGQIYFDGEGNLLPSSTGAVTTVDFSVPAGNKDQLNVFGTGDIIAASWATAGTDIIGQMHGLRKAARKKSGYPLAHAFYGENILDFLLGNNKLKEFLNRNPAMQTSLISGDIPDGLFNLNWHPFYEAFFEDSAGTLQDWWTGDTICFTPDPSPDWWDWILGSYEVPSDLIVANDATSALPNFATTHGMFSYATITTDPPGIKHNAGDTFLPAMKVPGAIFIADVTP